MKVETVSSKDDLINAIEAEFGVSGLAQHLAPFLENTANSFSKTVLGGLSHQSDALPDDWSGYQATADTQLPPGTDFPEARQAFARDIEQYFTHSTIGNCIQERRLMGGYKIKFPEFLFAGTGEAAAKLVAATL